MWGIRIAAELSCTILHIYKLKHKSQTTLVNRVCLKQAYIYIFASVGLTRENLTDRTDRIQLPSESNWWVHLDLPLAAARGSRLNPGSDVRHSYSSIDSSQG